MQLNIESALDHGFRAFLFVLWVPEFDNFMVYNMQIHTSSGEGPSWAPLRDNYMLTNSKLKDWDKMPVRLYYSLSLSPSLHAHTHTRALILAHYGGIEFFCCSYTKNCLQYSSRMKL